MQAGKQLLIISYFAFIVTIGCTQNEIDKLQLIDPMIGTDGAGHTFPGATTPFGMVQLSPSNDFKGWAWCSGYHYSDSIIKGFAHTHISGAGLSGLGDILLMPTIGKLLIKPGSEENPDAGYRSRFSHDNESAHPGYYQVYLQDYQVNVELTASPRVGFHKYTYEKDGVGNIIIDPTHNLMEQVNETEIKVLSNQEISGYKQCDGEAGKRKVYFYAWFSKPFKTSGIAINDTILQNKQRASGKNTKAYVSYNVNAAESIEIKVAISFVSYQGAKQNFDTEAANLNFYQALAKAENLWKQKLDKFQIESLNMVDSRTINTAIYHSFISPNLISDVNGDYIIEGEKYNSKEPSFSTFSTWDTYRALHPMFSIIEHKATADFVNSLVSRYAVQKVGLPIWELLGHDNKCMIGYNSVSPMVEAVLKGVDGINAEAVFDAVFDASNDLGKHSPNYDVNGMKEYLLFNFVSANVNSSVSKTVEQNYYDWCIAQLANKLGNKELKNQYLNRSLGYRNIYNADEGYLWPKLMNGQWRSIDTNSWKDYISNYVSGNIWGYTTYVPHDMETLIEFVGGNEEFGKCLDAIFTEKTKIGGETHVDISGFIGKYGHGDEPSHHMPYLYNYIGQPWKTQKYVRQVMDDFYNDSPNGLINNDDLGQMSAWYIFSAFGFYPVNPCSLYYIIGSPKVRKASFILENGNIFTVVAKNNSKLNTYVQSVMLNGEPINKNYLSHDEIMRGGKLEFTMGKKPNKDWGTNPEGFPKSKVIVSNSITKVNIPYSPFDKNDNFLFENSYNIVLETLSKGVKIYYTLDGSEPNFESIQYQNPIKIESPTEIRAVSISEEGKISPPFIRKYYSAIDISSNNSKVKIQFKNAPRKYGDESGMMLFDRLVGTNYLGDGYWTGWDGNNCECVIDLGEERSLSSVNIGYLSASRLWIFPPKLLRISYSVSGTKFNELARKDLGIIDEDETEFTVVREKINFENTKIRFLKVLIENTGVIPDWHAAAGHKPWLFIDEIMIN